MRCRPVVFTGLRTREYLVMTGSSTLRFTEHRNTSPATEQARTGVLAAPGFGQYFTDHMVSISWTPGDGWHDARLDPYGPLTLDPAAAVLHYGQEIFEGLKVYRHADGSVWSFRPDVNAERMRRSARRLALPELSVEDFLASVEILVRADIAWVPSGEETSMYLRPFMFGEEAFLGVRPARAVRYLLIACPVGCYFPGGVKPVSIWLAPHFSRAGNGGTGAAKCGGNYASSLAAQVEASEHGCQQVCFLDAAEQRWVEELGGMNLFFVCRDGRLLTPELSGTILEGVTRSSVLALAKEMGLDVEERRISFDEWRDGANSGEIQEVFACGTAAVITPVSRLLWDGGEMTMGDGSLGAVTLQLRQTLVDLQYGRAEDVHGWMYRIA
jgi:branched-chain amino acid aminotransferase